MTFQFVSLQAMFLLSKSWFFIDTIFRIFGVYPLQRIGKEELRPTPKCRFWFRYIFTAIWVQVLMVTPMAYILCKETTLKEYSDAFIKSLAATSIDKLTFAMTFLGQIVLHFTCLKHMDQLGKCLVSLQQDFNTKVRIFIEDKNTLKFYFFLFIWLSFEVANYACGYLSIHYKIQSELNLSYMATNAGLIGMILFQAFVTSTPFYFTFVYTETTMKILDYCKSINKQSEEIIMKESNMLIHVLKQFNKMSAPFLFYIISYDFCFVIIMGFFIYVRTNTLLFVGSFSWQDWLIFTGFVFHFLRTILLLYVFCTLSDDVASEVQELKTDVIDFEVQNGRTTSIIQKLDQFKGFSAYGYFTLNQSLLTGMTTNFATFLVILIQFKQAEGTD